MKTIAKRFPWTVRLLGVAAVILLASYRSYSVTRGGPCGQTRHEFVSADSRHYLPGEPVTISGRRFAPSCDVMMAANVPGGTIELGTATTDLDGKLSFTYLLGSITGDYSIQAETTDGAISMATTQFSSGIYVTTDKNDYAPGDTVTFSGRGFQAGETINLTVQQTDPGGVPDRNFTAVADANGTFVSSDLVMTDLDLGTGMTVIATGQTSGLSAQTNFTDALTWVTGQKSVNQTGAATATSIIANFGNDPTPGNLVVAVVGAFGSGTAISSVTSDTTWTQAVHDAGTATAPAQGIFYKISTGAADGSVTASFSTSTTGTIAIFEFSGVLNVIPILDGTNSVTGTTTPATIGTFSAGATTDLLVAGWSAAATSQTLIMGTPTNSFLTESGNDVQAIGVPAKSISTRSADKKTSPANTTGTSSMTGTAAVKLGWRGQVAAFKAKSNTTVTMVPSPNPSVTGQSVALTATITITAGSGSGTGPLTGTVAFSTVTNGTGALCTATLPSLSCNTTALFSNVAGGTVYQITATYSGDNNYSGDVSPNTGATVTRASTSTSVALTSGTNPSTYGDSLTFTATVAASAPGSGTPNGTVDIKEGAAVICSTPALVGGSASCSSSALTGGAHSITAVYNPGTPVNFLTSTSSAISQTVNKTTSSIAASGSPNPSNPSVTVTYSATITVGGAAATGSVTFKDGATTLCTGTVAANAASCTSTLLATTGDHTITATYSGDGNYLTSATTYVQTVKITTTTTVTASPVSPSTVTQPVTLTATVVSSSATGNVTFKEGATTLCAASVVSSGIATCTTTALVTGTVTATYNGDATFAPSSGTLAYTVNAGAAACFRSLVSGPWNQPSSWQQAATCAGAFSAATSLPTSNAVGIQIRVGHVITVPVDSSAKAMTVDAGGQLVVASGQTLSIADGTGIDAAINGTLQVGGTVTLAPSSSFDVQGTATILAGGLLNGNGGSGATMPALTVEGVFNVDLGGAFTTVGSGPTTVTVNGPSGVMNINGSLTGTDTFTINSGGRVNNAGSISMATISSLQVSGTLALTGTATFSVSRGNGGTLGSVNSGGVMSLADTSTFSIIFGTATYSVASGGTLDIGPAAFVNGTGSLIVASGANLNIGSADGIVNSTTLGNVRTSSGTADSYSIAANYTYDGTAAQVTGNALPTTVNNLIIANTGGTVTPTSNLQTDGTLTVLAGAKFQKFGAFTYETGAGGVSNAGTIEFSGTTSACGEADNLLIRSSILGTQRPWAGAGTFTISDVDVQDQVGSASINALSSTNTGNNGANWNIVAGCTLNTATTTSVSSSVNPSIYGSPVNFTATITPSAATGAVQFVVDGNPSGAPVTVSGGTAAVSTSSLTVGTHTVVANFVGTGVYTNSTGTLSPVQNVNQKSVTASVTANNKTYDGNTTATIASCSLAGVVGGDTVTCTAGGPNTFANRNAGNGKTVTATGITLGGAAAANYSLSSTSATTTANITTLAITVTAVSSTKTYDGNTSSAGVPTVSPALISPDTSAFIQTFDTRNAGTGKTLTPSGTISDGNGGNNYAVTFAPVSTGTINALPITVTAVTASKTYDQTTTSTGVPTVSPAVISPDTASFTQAFDSKNAGPRTLAASGSVSDGNGGNNYAVSFATASGTITPRALAVTATGANKIYDGTTSATVTLADDRIAGDVFTDAYTSASFTDKNAGNGKTINVSGISISGADAGNYTANTTAIATGNITPRALTISATGVNKVFDGTTVGSVVLTDNRIGGDVFTDGYVSAVFATRNVGTGIAVSVTGISISGVDAGNYTFNTTASTTANITAKTVTATIAASDKVYDSTTAATITSCTLAGVVAPDSVSCVATNGQFSDASFGLNKTVTADVALAGAEAGNYAVAPTASTTANITKASLTVTGITANDKVYDRTTVATLNVGGATLVGIQGTDNVTLDTTGAAGAFADKDAAANKAVTISGLTLLGAQAGDYTLTQPSTTATITPLYLTVSGITANNKIYDALTTATLDTSLATLNGVIAPDVVTLSTVGAAGSFANKTVGTAKPVTVSGLTIGGADVANYGLTQPTTSADISARALTVSGVTANNKVYDGTAVATLNTGSAALVGIQGSDVVTLNTGGATGAFADKNVANGKSVTVAGLTISGADATNYTVSQPSTSADITPKALVGSITASNKIYDGTASATIATRTLSGVIAPDAVSYVGGTATSADKNVGTGKTVTASGLSLSGLDAGNYTVNSSATASADITAKTLVVSATGVNKVYDGTTSATVTLADDRIAGDVFTTAYASASFGSKSVGAAKPVSVSGISISGTDAGNYAANTTASTTADITGRPLTISAVGISKVYDGTTVATVGLTDNRVAGDVFTDSYVSAVFADKNVANGITVNVTGISISGVDAGDYTFNTTASTTANITPKTVTATIAASSKVYDGNTSATITGCSLAGVVAPDSVSCTGSNGQFSDASFGLNKTVTADVALSGTDAGNYSVAPTATTTADITKAALTVSGITASDKVYDRTTVATLNTVGAALVGVVAGDSVTLDATGAVGTFDNKNVGLNKAVTISGLTIGGAQAVDYTLTQPSTTATITALYLTVSGITANNKIYDATTVATLDTSLATLNGVIAPDAVTLDTSLAAGAFANKAVGTAKPVTVSGLTISGADVANYGLTQPTTSADITARNLTVSGVTANNKVYDGTAVATLNTGSAALVGIQGSDVVTLNTGSATGAFADKNVANGKSVTVAGLTISGADATNYTVSQPTTSADITPKALVGSITASNKVYDGTTSATIATRTLSGVIAPDVVSYVGGTATFADKNVGTAKTVTASGLALSGGDAGNYTVNSSATASADITAKTLVVSATGVNKVYDGTTSATVTLSDDRIAGDVFTTAYASASFATKSVGAGKPVSVAGISISGTDAGNYAANTTASTIADITGRPLTISAVGISKIYDGTTTATVGLTDNRVAGDVFTDGYVSASFGDKNVGTGKPVSVTGISISGADAGNYTFNTTASTTADITAKSVTATIAASDKIYDGNATATITSCTLAGVVAGDAGNVSCTATNGQFSDASAGLNKTVTADVALAGTEAGNYAVAPTATTTATITKAALTVSGITASDKVYDRTTVATLNTASAALVGVIGGDTVTLDTTGAVGTFNDKNVGLNKAVTISGLTIGGAQMGDYTLTQPSTTATITALYLTVSGITANNKIYDATTTATINTAGAVLNGAITPDVVTLDTTSATGAFGTKTVANGKTVQISGLTIGGADAGNYGLTQPTTTADITARNLTVSGVSANNRIYDGTTVATLNTGSAALVGIQGSDAVTLNTGSATGAFADKNVANGKPVTVSGLTISGADSGNYTVSQPSASADITPKSVTASITASNKVYDGTTTATITACTPSGVINPDIVTCTGTAGTFDTANAGTGKTVTATVALSGADAANYVLSSTTATTTADIAKAPQTITFAGLANKTYGDADFSVSATASSTLTDSFTASGNCTVTGSTVHITGAGSCTITAHQAGDGNYNAATDVPQSFTIAKAEPTLTATGNTCTYDGNPCAGSGTATGVFSENLTPVTLAYKDISNTLLTAAPVSAGTYSVAARFAGDANYNQKQSASATITINKAVASVTPAAATKTYGAADPAFTGTLAGFLAGDGVTATYSRTAGETVAGSPYTISATLAPAGVLGNYNITYNTANFTISQATASVTPAAATKTYGAADPAFTGTLSGFLAGDGVTATYSRTAGETVAGSPYTISATLAPAGVLGNYNITYNTANFTISQATASVTPAAASKTYGAADPAFTGTLAGFQAGDGVTATYSRTAGETVAGSPYTISATLAPAGVLANYSITYNTASFTISQASASVTPAAASKTYGAADPAFTGTLAGFQAGDGVTATYSRTAGETVAGSPYTISATLAPAGVLGNYNITYNTASFTISQATASVTPAAATKTYGAADPALTGTLAGFQAGDGVTATYSRTAGETVAGSPYTISATLAPAGVLGNYNITYNTANFTITKSSQTITLSGVPASAAYGATFTVTATSTSGQSVTVAASGSCTISGLTVTMTSGTGTCNLAADQAGDSNYNAATQATQTATASKIAPTTTFTGAPASAAFGSTFTVASTTNSSASPVYTSSGACSNVGTTYTMTSGTGTCTSTVTWAADSNYNAATLSQTTAASTIAPTTTFTGAPASAAFPSTFTVASTTNSSASPVYTSSGSCSNVGTTYTMTSGTGTCTSTVTWAADANYSGATLSQTTTASKIDPTTTFTGAPASAAFGSTFTVASTTNSSASPVYTSSGGCSNAGTTYTMTSGTTTCTATVTWAADSNYNGATKSQTTTATKINPTTTFTGAPASAAYGTSFTVASTTNSTASPVYTAGGSCGNSGATYTILSGTGTCTSTVTWAADSNYNGGTRSQTTAATYAASTTTLTSSVNPSNYGQAVTFTVTVAPPTSPTGSVSFYNTSSGATCAALGTSALIDTQLLALGSAQTSTSALATGANGILACYSGDGNFASSSSALTQTVNPAPVVSINPTSLSFGNQLSGTSSSAVPVTLTNTGTAALTPVTLTITGPNASFFTKTTTCGASLAAGASCTISVTFSPTASGVATAILTLTDNDKNVAGSQQFVQLTGAGTSSITGGSLFQYGIFATANGCGAITETGNGSLDSFDSTVGYAASHTNSGGNAGTNGNATLSGNAVIYGSVASPLTGTGSCTTGSMKAYSTSGHASATGGLVHLDDPVFYAAPAPPSPAPPTTNQGISGTCGSIAGCTNAGTKTVNLAPGQYGNLSISGNTTAHVSKGIYNINSLTLSGNSILLVDSGPVVVNIAGTSVSGNTALDLSGGSVLNPTGIPINAQFYYGGSKATKLSGHVQTYSVVYAPNSAINLSGGSDFFGSIIGNTINMSGNTALHYDRHLPSIAAGDYLWFNSAAMKVANIPTGGAKLYVTNATITINNGTPINVPNAVVNFSSTATSASTIWDVTNNRWNTTVPRATVNGNTTIHTFIDGLALLVPAGGFVNGIQDVTWSAAFSTDSPGVTFQWQWGAAEYTSFSTIYGNGTNSNLLGVVPVDAADPAGTPATYKAYLTDGATGAGGSSYTGLSVGSAGVAPTIAPASVAPSSLGFGPQTVGTTSASMPVVLTNNQATSLTITSIAVSTGGTDFAQTNNCPPVLAGGGSCTVNVTFTPTVLGARTGKITINDNANNSPQTASLTGTGQ